MFISTKTLLTQEHFLFGVLCYKKKRERIQRVVLDTTRPVTSPHQQNINHQSQRIRKSRVPQRPQHNPDPGRLLIRNKCIVSITINHPPTPPHRDFSLRAYYVIRPKGKIANGCFIRKWNAIIICQRKDNFVRFIFNRI